MKHVCHPVPTCRSVEEHPQQHHTLHWSKLCASNRAGRKCSSQNMADTKTPDGSRPGHVGHADRTTPVSAGRRPPPPARLTSSLDASDRCRCKQEIGKEKARPEKRGNRDTQGGNGPRG